MRKNAYILGSELNTNKDEVGQWQLGPNEKNDGGIIGPKFCVTFEQYYLLQFCFN